MPSTGSNQSAYLKIHSHTVPDINTLVVRIIVIVESPPIFVELVAKHQIQNLSVLAHFSHYRFRGVRID